MTLLENNKNIDDGKIVLPIQQWSSWQQQLELPVSPDVSFLELSLRRKLGLLAKMCLQVANDCAGYDPDLRVVFASRHGDLVRTTGMLEEIVSGEPLSPTAFSMAVLNASPGVYSMLAKNILPSTAISAGEHTFGMGLLEAGLQWLSQPEQPVLYLYAEDIVPAIYQTSDAATYLPHAVGILLSGASPKFSIKIHSETMKLSGFQATVPMSMTWIESMRQWRKASWQGEGRAWHWEFDHAAH